MCVNIISSNYMGTFYGSRNLACRLKSGTYVRLETSTTRNFGLGNVRNRRLATHAKLSARQAEDDKIRSASMSPLVALRRWQTENGPARHLARQAPLRAS